MNLTFIKPSEIDLDEVVSTATESVAAYSGAETYDTGEQALYEHRIWQARVNGVTGVTPGTDDTKWEDAGPSNESAMFDTEAQTRTTAASGTLTVGVPAAAADGLFLGDLDARTVTVSVDKDGDEVYAEQTFDLWDSTVITNFAELYFNEPVFKTKFTLTDLPKIPDVTVNVTVEKEGETVSVGHMVVGRQIMVGQEMTGLTSELIDYSTVTTDEFGVVSIVRRGVVEKFTTTALIQNNRLDMLKRRFKEVSSVPVVVIGGANRFQAFTVFGLVSMSIDVAYYAYSHITVEIKEYV